MRRPKRPLAADRIRWICEEFSEWNVEYSRDSNQAALISRDRRRLENWLEELCNSFHALMRSRRWKLGNTLIGCVRGQLFVRRELDSVARLYEVFQKFRDYKLDSPQAKPLPSMSLADLYLHLGFVRERLRQWRSAADAYRQALALSDPRPEHYCRLGRVRERQGRLRDAAMNYEMAVGLDPENAEIRFRLGEVREKTLSKRPCYQPVSGLGFKSQGDWHGAAAAYLEATRLAPEDAVYHFRRANACEKVRDFSSAAESFQKAVELAPDKVHWLYRLGRAREQNVELESAMLAYDSLLRVDPRHRPSRNRLYAIQVKLARWRDASQSALLNRALEEEESDASGPGATPSLSNFMPRLQSTPLQRLCSLLESDDLLSMREEIRHILVESRSVYHVLPVDWWFALHWRLITTGWFSLAYEVKDIAASVLLHQFGDTRPRRLKDRFDIAKAYVQLGDSDSAYEYLEDLIAQPNMDRSSNLAVQKLVADIDAFYGDVTNLQRLALSGERINLPEAESEFRKLISGRTVAIVGPLPNGLCCGKEIDSYDVVVRPNFLGGDDDVERSSHLGSRTDISYFNGVASRMLASDMEEALMAQRLRMVVMRPFTFRQDKRWIARQGDLRYNPNESNAYLRARSFGVQRIIHDVLRYQPREVKVFNIDLFVSSLAYKTGYRASELLTDLDPFYLGSGHDYRSDFMFTKRMRETSLVAFDPVVTDLLERTPQEYLSLLEAPAEGRMTGSEPAPAAMQ